MIIEVPGYQTLDIRKLLLDYNGTIAVDGLIRESVKERLKELSEQFEIFILTADTHGTARKQCENLGVRVHTFPVGDAMDYKLRILEEEDSSHCACIGNGRNDRKMFEKAALSIGVIDKEGAYMKTLNAADLCVTSSEDALDLLRYPKRLIAGLRG